MEHILCEACTLQFKNRKYHHYLRFSKIYLLFQFDTKKNYKSENWQNTQNKTHKNSILK